MEIPSSVKDNTVGVPLNRIKNTFIDVPSQFSFLLSLIVPVNANSIESERLYSSTMASCHVFWNGTEGSGFVAQIVQVRPILKPFAGVYKGRL